MAEVEEEMNFALVFIILLFGYIAWASWMGGYCMHSVGSGLVVLLCLSAK